MELRLLGTGATTKTWHSQINIFIKINKYLFIKKKKKVVPPMQGTPVPSLVGKLRSHIPSGAPPQKKKKKKSP